MESFIERIIRPVEETARRTSSGSTVRVKETMMGTVRSPLRVSNFDASLSEMVPALAVCGGRADTLRRVMMTLNRRKKGFMVVP